MSKPLVITANKDNYFSIKEQKIYLKIPVPSKEFELKSVNYLSRRKGKKAILIHITDDTPNGVCGKEAEEFLIAKIPFSDVKYDIFPAKFKLKKNQELYVYIINDFPEDFQSNSIKIKWRLINLFHKGNHFWGCNDFYLKLKKKEIDLKDDTPEEAGGGVIIENDDN